MGYGDLFKMSDSDRRVLIKLFTRHLRQGNHRCNLIEIMKLIRLVFEEEFTEDNRPTQKAFIDECVKESESHYVDFKSNVS